MWDVIVFVLGFVVSIFIWPSLRLWTRGLWEHPEETIRADMTKLQEKLRDLHLGA